VTPASRRALTSYLGLVVAPVLLAVSLGSWQWLQHSNTLLFERYERAVHGSAYLLTQALGRSQREFSTRAPVVEVQPPYAPAVVKALAGDTVAGLASTTTSLELTVVLSDSAGAIRMIREPFRPPFLEVVPSRTMLGISIYLRGKRSATTDPPVGPTSLSESTLGALATAQGGVRFDDGSARGVYGVVRARPETAPELVLLVGEASPEAAEGWLLTLLPMFAIVLFLALTAAWTMARQGSPGRRSTSFAQTALVALIPVLAGAAILLAFDQGFNTEAHENSTDELSRATLLVRQLELPLSPDLIKRATGFEVAVIGPEGVERTTVEDAELIDALSALRLPPPSWMSFGIAATSGGPASYEIVRVGSDRGLVLLRTDLDELTTSLREALLWISAIMFVPALLFLALASARRPASPSPIRRPVVPAGPSTN
jgi:hypothetical protein